MILYDNTVEKNQHIKVISTKLTVDQYDAFSLLTEYLFKTGVVKDSTPSALLRNSITQLLNSYHDDIENYRSNKKQSPGNINESLRLIKAKIDNKQTSEKKDSSSVNQRESLLQPVNDDGQVHTLPPPIKKSEDLGEKAQDPSDSLYKMDLRKFMLSIVTIDRNMKNSDKAVIYLEMTPDREVAHVIPVYGLEAWKKQNARIGN